MYLIMKVDVTGADLGYFAGVRIDKDRAETIMKRIKRVVKATRKDDQLYSHEYWCYWPSYQNESRVYDPETALGEIMEANWVVPVDDGKEAQFDNGDATRVDVPTMLVIANSIQFSCCLKNSDVTLKTVPVIRDLIEKIAAGEEVPCAA